MTTANTTAWLRPAMVISGRLQSVGAAAAITVGGPRPAVTSGLLLALRGDQGPAGPPALVEQNPVFTWSGGAISRIDYASGNYKLLTYNAAGLPSRIDYHIGATLHRKDFAYSSAGDLISITDSTQP